MPLEWGKDGGSLLWVRNPFTGAVTYFTEVHKKRSGFPPADSPSHSQTIRSRVPALP